VIVSAVLVDDSGPIEEAGIGPLSLAKVKGIDPRPRAKEARKNSSSPRPGIREEKKKKKCG